MANNDSAILDKREDKRRKFAFFLRTLHSSYLRKIAESFSNVDKLIRSDRDPSQLLLDSICDELLHRDLRNRRLGGCSIRGRRITYKQARVIYELIFKGKYGGFNCDDKPLPALVLPGKAVSFASFGENELFGERFYNKPDGWFPGKSYAVGSREK